MTEGNLDLCDNQHRTAHLIVINHIADHCVVGEAKIITPKSATVEM